MLGEKLDLLIVFTGEDGYYLLCKTGCQNDPSL